ncbi:MAG: signal recognition particle-docking protein FtsY [Candidatus Aenigmarchaeota archaeon]|nr:signal recognition particle-docking protein FtsY [Candidatus Aenigmarchaeota archaeon]
MFGFLKKKLKESVEKISNVISSKDEPQIEEVSEKIEEIVKEEPKTEEKIIERVIEAEPEVEPTEAVIEEEINIENIPEEPVVEEKVVRRIEKEVPKKTGFIQKIKKAISEKELTENDIKDILWELQISLVESDVAVEVAEKIVNDLRTNLIGQSVEKKKIDEIVKNSLKESVKEILNVDSVDLIKQAKQKKPYVIIFLGFNGSGKTTTIARVGHMLKDKGFSIVMAAADTWRAASIEQLEEHGKNLGINVIKQKYGSDPAAVIFDAVKHAKANDIDVVLADTAGRSHANQNLIEELKKICRVNTPDMKILVIDALTGNDVVEQTSTFNDAVGVDAMILTKTDVYEKGGAILSSVHNIKKPILFLGVGQEYKDLKPFDKNEIAKNLME